MINEVSEGAKLSFMVRKETDLERKVRKLEQDMMHLDSILNKEKSVRNNSTEYEKDAEISPSHDRLLWGKARTMGGGDRARTMEGGDGPDPKPVRVHRTAQVQPGFFFTWDCTPYDFHNNNAQRSIYTLLDQWQPGGISISADQFKKQLSALLAANKESVSTSELSFDLDKDLEIITDSCERFIPNVSIPLPDKKKPELDMKNSDLDKKQTSKDPALETDELLSNLEKKLKAVESKCRDDYVKVMNPNQPNQNRTEDEIAENGVNETEITDEDSIIIDDILFEILKHSPEDFGRKPIELAKEVDDLQALIKNYNQIDDSIFHEVDSKK